MKVIRSNRFFLCWLLVSVLISLNVSTVEAKRTVRVKKRVPLNVASLVEVDSIVCMKIMNRWEPGRVRGDSFLPFSSKIRVLRRRIRDDGPRKERIVRRLEALRDRIRDQREQCFIFDRLQNLPQQPIIIESVPTPPPGTPAPVLESPTPVFTPTTVPDEPLLGSDTHHGFTMEVVSVEEIHPTYVVTVRFTAREPRALILQDPIFFVTQLGGAEGAVSFEPVSEGLPMVLQEGETRLYRLEFYDDIGSVPLTFLSLLGVSVQGVPEQFQISDIPVPFQE